MKNHDYSDIKIVIGTAIAMTLAIPILDGISNVVQSAFSKLIHGWQLEMGLDEAEAQAATEVISPNPCATQAIGFAIPSEEEYCDCEEE